MKTLDNFVFNSVYYFQVSIHRLFLSLFKPSVRTREYVKQDTSSSHQIHKLETPLSAFTHLEIFGQFFILFFSTLLGIFENILLKENA